jgi:hypothetical protein
MPIARDAFQTHSTGRLHGDGIADLIVGAANASNGASASGSTYVMFGKKKGWTTPFDLGGL